MAQKLRSLPPQVDELKRRGIASVIPLFDGKRPGYGDWQKIDESEAKARFWAWNGDDRLNFGIRLGPAFGSLVDIDLDSAEARSLWRYFFPESACFGRGGHVTHVLYKQVGRDLMESKQFIWDKRDEKTVLLEVRFNGQTMGPGSVHPDSGERIEWMSEGGLAEISSDELKRRSGMLAAASLLLRDWSQGWRDEVCVCLAGAMVRGGWDPNSVDHFFESIASCAGDEELDGRLKAERLERLLSTGGRVPGLKKLMELVGDSIGSRLIEWLELRGGSLLEEMNERHALVRVGGSVYILDEQSGDLLSREAFGMLWANRVVMHRGRETTADKFWMSHESRREYPGGLQFSPSWDGSDESEWTKRTAAYNLWRGWGVEECRGCGQTVDIGGYPISIEWSAWARHVYEEVCWEDRKVWKWMLGWLAHRVCRPWEPPGSAIVMIGERGDGKGTVAGIFGRLFGKSYMSVTQQSQLVGKFNSHLEDKVFVFADEATWGGDKVGEGVLKVMITEDQRVIERKGKEAYTVKNCVGYMIASNHDWVVPVGRYERRFFVSKMRGRRRGQWDYFDGLRKSMLPEAGGQGCGVMLWQLRQLWSESGVGEDWRVGQIVKWSPIQLGAGGVGVGGAGEWGGSALAEQWLESASSGEKWIATWLLEWAGGRGVGDVRWVVKGHLIIGRAWQNYVNWCGSVGVRHPMTEVPFAKMIRKMLPVGGERKLVNVGDGREYGLPLLKDNPLAYFEGKIGISL